MEGGRQGQGRSNIRQQGEREEEMEKYKREEVEG